MLLEDVLDLGPGQPTVTILRVDFEKKYLGDSEHDSGDETVTQFNGFNLFFFRPEECFLFVKTNFEKHWSHI